MGNATNHELAHRLGGLDDHISLLKLKEEGWGGSVKVFGQAAEQTVWTEFPQSSTCRGGQTVEVIARLKAG